MKINRTQFLRSTPCPNMHFQNCNITQFCAIISPQWFACTRYLDLVHYNSSAMLHICYYFGHYTHEILKQIFVLNILCQLFLKYWKHLKIEVMFNAFIKHLEFYNTKKLKNETEIKPWRLLMVNVKQISSEILPVVHIYMFIYTFLTTWIFLNQWLHKNSTETSRGTV